MFLIFSLLELTKSEISFFVLLIILLPTLIVLFDVIIRYVVNTSAKGFSGETGLFYSMFGDKLFSKTGLIDVLVMLILVWALFNVVISVTVYFIIPWTFSLIMGSGVIAISVLIIFVMFIFIPGFIYLFNNNIRKNEKLIHKLKT